MTNLLQRIYDFATNEITADVNNTSVTTDDLDRTNAVDVYRLGSTVSVPNDTFTDIDDWTGVDRQEIGSMSNGKDWSPDRDGRYLCRLQLTSETLNGTTTNVNGLIQNSNELGNNQKLGDWVSGGDRSGTALEWVVNMTSSDSEFWQMRHRSGSSEDLNASRTQLTIIKIG